MQPQPDLPLISIVTPSYNQASYLRRTLESLLGQGYPRLELIVIDGGSNDGSVEIIREFADHIAYWVSEPDRGQSHAINKGFARATGDVFGWLNSDDLLLPGALMAVGEIFAAYPEIGWITGRTTLVDVDDRLSQVWLKRKPRFRRLIAGGWYHGRALGFINQEGTFWRRALWELAGGHVDETRHYSMDYELWRRFARYADLVSVDRSLGAFRKQPNQKTSQLDAYFKEAGVRLPAAARFVAWPIRGAFTILSWPFAPRLIYDSQAGRWQFKPGPFFQPGIGPK